MGILSNQKDNQEKDAQTAAEPKAVLNEQQEIAANHEYGSAFISACPGSGKTRVVVERTARLIDKGHSPRNILCITFTNKAAAEMKERLRARLGDAVSDLYVSTFHSLSANILRRFGRSIGYVDGMTIMDSSDQEDVMSQTARQLGFDYKRGEIFGLCWIANTARERLLPIERFGEVHDDENKVRVAQEYVERIKKNNQVDFSGLLSETIRLLKKDTEVLQRLQDRFKFIQVDEAQDTNLAQFEMVNLLSVHKNVVMVGDVDQSIYGWRGARYDNINDFVKQNQAKVIEFPWNYRSTPEIVERAEQLIRWNDGRDKVQFKTVNASGAPIEYYEHDSSREEGSWVADKVYEVMMEHGYGPEDCAVLYRVNAHSQHIELGFRNLGMPVNMVGGQSFFDRAEIKDCFAMLKFYVNPRDGMALSRFINKPARSIGNVTLGKIENYAQENNVDMLEALRLAPQYLASVPKKEAVLASLKLIYETFSADYSQYNIGQMLYEFVTKLNYLDFLREKYADDFLERENYINELSKDAAVAGEASRKNTEGYLARQALTSSSDKETQQGRVTLMTMHAAKGLEFPVVIIPSMEDDILPHFRSKAERSVDEERRLCYVAMTRAKERLILSRCRNRQVRSGRNFMNKRTKPSQFLTEMGVLEEKA